MWLRPGNYQLCDGAPARAGFKLCKELHDACLPQPSLGQVCDLGVPMALSLPPPTATVTMLQARQHPLPPLSPRAIPEAWIPCQVKQSRATESCMFVTAGAGVACWSDQVLFLLPYQVSTGPSGCLCMVGSLGVTFHSLRNRRRRWRGRHAHTRRELHRLQETAFRLTHAWKKPWVLAMRMSSIVTGSRVASQAVLRILGTGVAPFDDARRAALASALQSDLADMAAGDVAILTARQLDALNPEPVCCASK